MLCPLLPASAESPSLETVRLSSGSWRPARRRCAGSPACVWSWPRIAVPAPTLPAYGPLVAGQLADGRRDCRASALGHRPEGAAPDGRGAVGSPWPSRPSARPADCVAQLVHLEVTARRERRIQRRIRAARFLDAEDAGRLLVRGATGFRPRRRPAGLRLPLSWIACCQHDYRVRLVTPAELVTMLVKAHQQGRLTRKLAQLAPLRRRPRRPAGPRSAKPPHSPGLQSTRRVADELGTVHGLARAGAGAHARVRGGGDRSGSRCR